MTLTLYHNPRCSKSREAKRILDAEGIPYETVLYLEKPPQPATLARLARSLDDPSSILRAKEAREAGWRDSDDAHDTDALARFLAAHPRALQRPILATSERAIIARPPERVRELV